MLGYTGTANHPHALVLQLPGRARPVLSSPLAAAERARVAVLLRSAGAQRGHRNHLRDQTYEMLEPG